MDNLDPHDWLQDFHVLATCGAVPPSGLLCRLRHVAADAVAGDVLRLLRGLPHRLRLLRYLLHLHLASIKHSQKIRGAALLLSRPDPVQKDSS